MTLPTDDKARKALPIFTYLTEYFPDATLAEVAVSVAGNEQHNPGQPLHWAREKSKDQLNTAFRHLWDHKCGTHKDVDGQWHLAKAIWRLKAELQLLIEAESHGTQVLNVAHGAHLFQKQMLQTAHNTLSIEKSSSAFAVLAAGFDANGSPVYDQKNVVYPIPSERI